MTNDELNQYILNYMENDKTRSAIMLTGAWGSGKSFYIQNSLKPFLKLKKNGKHKCIVVSLYGLNDTNDISKSIYLEEKSDAFKVNSTTLSAGKIFAKTIIKNFAGHYGLDISMSTDDLKALYESVDLTGKLLIFEDLERSGIDIIEVLGYVNCLVEQDGVKVLLIANETEIQSEKFFNEKKKFDQEKTKSNDQEFVTKYRREKEKTISDTINFEGDFRFAVKNILKNYTNVYLKNCVSKSQIEDFIHQCNSIGIKNLRTFIFACQKATEIFKKERLDRVKDEDYIKTIFYGILAFSKRMKSGEKITWKGNNGLSIDLGTTEYPLPFSCYKYIVNHVFDLSKIDDEKTELQEYRLYDPYKSTNDPDLIVIYSWFLRPEHEVMKAVVSVSERLKIEEDISFREYGKIAIELIRIKSCLGCNIDQAKELLVKNLYRKQGKIDAEYLFLSMRLLDETEQGIDEIRTLKKEMEESLCAKDEEPFGFDYQPSSVEAFYNNVADGLGGILEDRSFASRLKIPETIEMLKKCSAGEIRVFNDIFSRVYGSSSIKNYLSEDKETLEELKNEVDKLIIFPGYDKIQKKQIQFFEKSLSDFLKNL